MNRIISEKEHRRYLTVVMENVPCSCGEGRLYPKSKTGRKIAKNVFRRTERASLC